MNNSNNKKNDKHHPLLNILNLLILGLIVSTMFNIFLAVLFNRQSHHIDYSQFMKLVQTGNLDRVEISDNKLTMRLKSDFNEEQVHQILTEDGDHLMKPVHKNDVFYTNKVDFSDLSAFLFSYGVQFSQKADNVMMNFILSWILPIFIFSSIFNRLGKQGNNFMGMNKSKAKIYNIEEKTGTTFHDVAGQEEAKESLMEIVDFLHYPQKYIEIGAKQPKGALLVGPPGTGKTLLAKAVAGEANVPFFSLSGSDFVEMFVGVGASRVRDLFEQASKSAPCIIFIDEIDAIGKSRDNQFGGGNDEREQTLNQLLAELDGFDSSKGIVVLAATNRPDVLDKALLRPGRFDRQIIVERPDITGREAILSVHIQHVKLDDDVNLEKIAAMTSGASGADLANMVNEAALRAVRLGQKKVRQEDLQEAIEVVIAGKEMKDRILSDQEKRLVSCHEIGHALLSAIQKDGQPVQKITIVPRTMGSLGYTMQMPEKEKYLMTKDELLAEIRVLLGGRCAEELIYHVQTTGASNDIERATQLARNMITQYGMSDHFGMMGLESIQNKYLDGRRVMTCSDASGVEIDNEVKRIIQTCYKETMDILKENEDKLKVLAEHLYEKENITGEEFMDIFHQTNNENSIEKL